MKPRVWLSQKILESRLWKWLTIIGTILGILTAATALVDWWGNHFISKPVIEYFQGPSIKLEQTIDPEVLKRHKDSNSTIRIEKGITIYPGDKDGKD